MAYGDQDSNAGSPGPSYQGPPVSAAFAQQDPAMMAAFRDAIAKIESAGSGDYNAVGPQTSKGDQAYGRYQVMGANIPSWTQQALGKSMTPQEFLKDQNAQDTVFNHQWGQNLAKYGNANDAASAWFTGRPLSQGGNSSDVNGVTGNKYVDNFNRALAGLSSKPSNAAFASANADGQSDMPSAGATPMSGQQTPAMIAAMQGGGMHTNGVRDIQNDPNASMWDKFRDGGPGALFGMPSARPWDLGSALQGMGIAGMAINNPAGANAIAQVPAMEARSMVPRFATSNYQPETGYGMITDSRTGATRWAKIGQEFQKMPESALKDFNDKNAQINTQDTNLSQLRNIQSQLMNKEFDPGLLSRGQSYIDSLRGSTDPAEQKLYSAQHWLSLYHQDFLKNQTGTQTDKDAENAFHAIMPGGSQYDPVTMNQSISNIVKSEKARIDSNIQAQQGMMGRFRDQVPTGDYASRYAGIQSRMANDEATYGPKIQAFEAQENAARAAPTANVTSAPASKVSGGSTQTTGGSLENRTAVNPQTGDRMIMKGGKWQVIK